MRTKFHLHNIKGVIANGKMYIPLVLFTMNKGEYKEMLTHIKKYCVFHVPYMNREKQMVTKIEKQFQLTEINIDNVSTKVVELPLFWTEFDDRLIPMEDFVLDEDENENENGQETNEAESLTCSYGDIEDEIEEIKPHILDWKINTIGFSKKFKLHLLIKFIDYRITGSPFLFSKMTRLGIEIQTIEGRQFQEQLTNPAYNLYPNQVIIYDKIINSLDMTKGATAVVQTANGKTVIGFHVIANRKVKTLVVVHMRDLGDMWYVCGKNIFMNKLKIGIYSKHMKIDDYDIIIATIQTVIRKPASLFNQSIGLLIVDEAHHIGAIYLQKVLQKVNCQTLALTATPERIDGKTNSVYWGIGNCCYYENAIFDIPATLIEYEISVPKSLCSKWVAKYSDFDIGVHLMNDLTRNQIICDLCCSDRFKNKHILIFVHRVEHATKLAALIPGAQSYVGENKPKPSTCKLKEGQDPPIYYELPFARVVVATYAAFSEGKNNPEFEVVVIASQKPRQIQPLGRGVRKSKIIVDKHVTIIEIIDTIFYKMKRKYNRAKKYIIKSFKNLSIETIEVTNKDPSYLLKTDPYIKSIQSFEQSLMTYF